jgi:3-(3-hydroxy-phenyl)propionate hydroxylase
VLGSGFAVVTNRPPNAAERQLIDRYNAEVQVAQPGSELAAWLRRGHAAAAIIRPDRTVWGAGREIAELTRLLGSYLVAVYENQGAGVQ